MLMLMMIMRNKDNCILDRTAPVPWPSPLTRVVSLDSLSPVLSLTDVCDSWLPPQLVTSLESLLDKFVGPRFGPILSGQSHIQILTSHCEIYNSPSAEVR